ncbi:MAG TPA: hypothetical protein VMR62_29940 [Bryobacteraceae bacterium]|jgi:hypothetical protein|nr:hypothetical protein [Bryobacteraceae bacterium]
MIKFALQGSLPVAILLLCGGTSRMKASGDTPITVKDGGSILLIADGLDGGKTWTSGSAELRHMNVQGVLSSVKITEAGADRCGGDPKCGIDPSKPWNIRVVYNGRWITIASVNANKGVHVTFSPKVSFDQWKKSGGADQREFGHGDGRHISTIKVNGKAASLCAGKGGCAVTVVYTAP